MGREKRKKTNWKQSECGIQVREGKWEKGKVIMCREDGDEKKNKKRIWREEWNWIEKRMETWKIECRS